MWLGCCKIGMVTLPAADFAHFSSICRHSKDITSYINFAPADHDDGYHGGNHDNGSKFYSQIQMISKFKTQRFVFICHSKQAICLFNPLPFIPCLKGTSISEPQKTINCYQTGFYPRLRFWAPLGTDSKVGMGGEITVAEK